MRLSDERVRGFDPRWSEVTPSQRDHAFVDTPLRWRSMVAGDG